MPFLVRRLAALVAVALALSAPCLRASDAAQPPHERAPDTFRISLDTSTGPVVIEVTRSWAPLGADRLYNMVRSHFLDGARFFRVVPGFVVQFGLSGDPAQSKVWNVAFKDDKRGRGPGNVRGTLAFAKTQDPDSRTTQLFINLDDNSSINDQGFIPVGKVVSGMDAIGGVYSRYGGAPDQDLILEQGEAYLSKQFPKLDRIKAATIAPAIAGK